MTLPQQIEHVLAVLRETAGDQITDQYHVLLHVVSIWAVRTTDPAAMLALAIEALGVARQACIEADAERPEPS